MHSSAAGSVFLVSKIYTLFYKTCICLKQCQLFLFKLECSLTLRRQPMGSNQQIITALVHILYEKIFLIVTLSPDYTVADDLENNSIVPGQMDSRL